MEKNLLTKTALLALSVALAMPSTVLAAPPASAPIEMSVSHDGISHKVFVFGTALALVSTDGSIEISAIGPVGRVDVMIDGNLTKNVVSIDIPAGQLTKMALDKDSVIVKNVSAETAQTVKKQISDAYTAGADSVDVASLTNITAYKVNENGTLTNAAGMIVSSKEIAMTVSSVEAVSTSFTAEIAEIVKRAEEEAASKTDTTIPTVEVPKEKGSSSSSSSSNNSGSGSESGSGTTDSGTTKPTDPEGGDDGDEKKPNPPTEKPEENGD